MSDIVERLRHHARYGDGWTRPVAGEAADEIERLRAERDEASGLLVGPKQGRAIGALIEGARREEREACAALCEAWAKMEADIGALKAAVTRILGPNWPDDGLPVARAREWAATREHTAQALAHAMRARGDA